MIVKSINQNTTRESMSILQNTFTWNF